MSPFEIIKKVREQTSDIVLFHSACGKDSIVLLDMLSKVFEKVQPVFMYIVKDLEHIQKYIYYAECKYQVKFIQTPHFVLSNILKNGILGIKANPKQKLFTLSKIAQNITENTKIEWQIYGFKQSDGLNRRLMLKTYDCEAISYKSKKAYPLSTFKNIDCLNYIKHFNLIYPQNYGIKDRSSDLNIADPLVLSWVKKFYPNDYMKIINIFPECDVILWRYENQRTEEIV
jgi:sulfate adenylyltransferase subunit 2